MTAQDFGWALFQMRKGYRVARIAWTTTSCWIAIAAPDLDMDADTLSITCPHIVHSQNGNIIPWSPTHADLLMVDWMLA